MNSSVHYALVRRQTILEHIRIRSSLAMSAYFHLELWKCPYQQCIQYLHLGCRNKQDGDSWLDAAKRSRGGSFADPAIDERRGMAKFALVLSLLVPIAFGTTLPLLPPVAVSSLT